MQNLASEIAKTLGFLVSVIMTDMANQNASEEIFGSSTGPVTIVISHKAKQGYEEEFNRWLKGINKEASGYEGYMSVQVIEPPSTSNPEYVIIIRFDKYEHLKIWNDSDIRKQYLTDLRSLTEDESKCKYQSGLEYWFSLSEMAVRRPPSRHKMALVTWLALTPFIVDTPDNSTLAFGPGTDQTHTCLNYMCNFGCTHDLRRHAIDE